MLAHRIHLLGKEAQVSHVERERCHSPQSLAQAPDVSEVILDISSPATISQQTHEGLRVRSVEELPRGAPTNPQNYGQIKWLLFKSTLFVM